METPFQNNDSLGANSLIRLTKISGRCSNAVCLSSFSGDSSGENACGFEVGQIDRFRLVYPNPLWKSCYNNLPPKKQQKVSTEPHIPFSLPSHPSFTSDHVISMVHDHHKNPSATLRDCIMIINSSSSSTFIPLLSLVFFASKNSSSPSTSIKSL